MEYFHHALRDAPQISPNSRNHYYKHCSNKENELINTNNLKNDEQLFHLTGMNCTVKEIAHLLRLPFRTVKYEMEKNNLKVRNKFFNISDSRLTRYVREMLAENPNLGNCFYMKCFFLFFII